ncbi:HD domain-containing protein 2 [Elsinoe fawcettii]|nr:HD domain-containing protein 2 [Elsinoe fawcettii]
MVPGLVEEAVQTNAPPRPDSGLLKAEEAQKSHWTPQTVLSTLKNQPATNTSSPVPFFHLLERLKTTKREGWRRFGINHGESISDHMYRMSILTMLCPASLSSRLNVPHCTRMALIHDMAEALVGDITPVDGVLKPEKCRRETETMDYLCVDLLGKVGGGLTGEDIRKVWQEYEDNETLEAKFVHDIDKMELLLQMMEYERSHEGRIDLGEFSWVAQKIELDEVKGWCADLLKEREGFWKEVGKTPSGSPTRAEGRTNGTS